MPPAPLPFEEDIYELEQSLAALEEAGPEAPTAAEVKRIRREILSLQKQRFANLTAWDTVLVSRHPNRPQFLDYVASIFDEFVELHGDRAFGDDRAIRTGLARIGDHKVMLVGHHKGRNREERQQCFYGCAHPEGYRKALSKMQIAAKFGLPIVCLIDTPGAYPGIGAEERGQSQLIATSILEMTLLPTPIVCVVIGEGGSGGALGIGIGDRVGMLKHSYYSVISPEGCAGILWKHANDETKPRAAAALRLSADEVLKNGVIDEVIPEPVGGAHRNPREMGQTLKACLVRWLRELTAKSVEELLASRYDRYRNIGLFTEGEPQAHAPSANGTAISESSPARA